MFRSPLERYFAKRIYRYIYIYISIGVLPFAPQGQNVDFKFV